MFVWETTSLDLATEFISPATPEKQIFKGKNCKFSNFVIAFCELEAPYVLQTKSQKYSKVIRKFSFKKTLKTNQTSEEILKKTNFWKNPQKFLLAIFLKNCTPFFERLFLRKWAPKSSWDCLSCVAKVPEKNLTASFTQKPPNFLSKSMYSYRSNWLTERKKKLWMRWNPFYFSRHKFTAIQKYI